jgi:transposase
MGVSLSTVNRAYMAYDHGGIKALKPKANGRRKRENMTVAEEKRLAPRGSAWDGTGTASAHTSNSENNSPSDRILR